MAFDPRHVSDRDHQLDRCQTAVRQLNDISANNCLRHLWGIHPQPPDFVMEVSVETSESLHDQVRSLIIGEAGMSEYDIGRIIDSDMVEFIDRETTLQSDCQLWKDLHRGRITSSIFGTVLKAKNSPSLVKRIVENQ